PLWNTPQKIWVKHWPAGTCNTNTPHCWTITNHTPQHTRNTHIHTQQPEPPPPPLPEPTPTPAAPAGTP
ncbi:MAG: hypothetical protein OXF04_08335, partial [bacterium]|nr:hypothetical protein [bacterium]